MGEGRKGDAGEGLAFIKHLLCASRSTRACDWPAGTGLRLGSHLLQSLDGRRKEGRGRKRRERGEEEGERKRGGNGPQHPLWLTPEPAGTGDRDTQDYKWPRVTGCLWPAGHTPLGCTVGAAGRPVQGSLGALVQAQRSPGPDADGGRFGSRLMPESALVGEEPGGWGGETGSLVASPGTSMRSCPRYQVRALRPLLPLRNLLMPLELGWEDVGLGAPAPACQAPLLFLPLGSPTPEAGKPGAGQGLRGGIQTKGGSGRPLLLPGPLGSGSGLPPCPRTEPPLGRRLGGGQPAVLEVSVPASPRLPSTSLNSSGGSGRPSRPSSLRALL